MNPRTLVTTKSFALLIGVFFLLATLPLYGQDFGSASDEPIESTEQVGPEYHLMVKTRPLSYLLIPLSGGVIGSYNGEVDFVFRNNMSGAVGLNYMTFDAGSVFNDADSADFFASMGSIRLDYKIFLNEMAPGKYANGFFVGPYMKLKRSFIDFEATSAGSTDDYELVSNAIIVGGLLGFQAVAGRFVFNQTFGLGGGGSIVSIKGTSTSSNGATVPGAATGGGLALDMRLGMSIGFVIF